MQSLKQEKVKSRVYKAETEKPSDGQSGRCGESLIFLIHIKILPQSRKSEALTEAQGPWPWRLPESCQLKFQI